MIFTLVLSALLQSQTAPVAIVLRMEGAPTIQHAGSTRPARIYEILYADDRVSAGGAAKITVAYCPTNQKLAIPSGSSVVLGASAIRAASGKAPEATSFKCALPQVALGSENLERVGALRGRGDPPVALYTGGSVTSAHPTFKWEPVDGAKLYRLVITEDNDDHRVWSTEKPAPLSEMATATSVALRPGTPYRWELTAEADGKIVARQSTTFEIKPNAELSAIPSDPDARLLRAVALENSGYFAEAADTFRQLRTSNPNDERISRHLIWLYWNAGLSEASKRELARQPRGRY